MHSLAAASLAHGKAEGDALVCSDHPDAKEIVLELAGAVVTGRALDAGPLASSRALEGMTAVIVNLNKRYRAHAGVQITGLT
jgi:predicted dinucleotide-binding enzyme